jgi:hypothetical protein
MWCITVVLVRDRIQRTQADVKRQAEDAELKHDAAISKARAQGDEKCVRACVCLSAKVIGVQSGSTATRARQCDRGEHVCRPVVVC